MSDWTQPQDEGLLGCIFAIEALHRQGESDVAVSALNALARQEGLDGLDVSFLAAAYEEVSNREAAIQFLKGWLDQHPQITSTDKILSRAKRDLRDPKLSNLLALKPSRDYEAEQAAGFQRLVDRVAPLPDKARLLEIFGNSFVGIDMQRLALQRLARLDDTVYREKILELIADHNVSFAAKKELISELRNAGYELQVTEILAQCALRATDFDRRDAELLIRAGARDQGIRHLQGFASNPDSSKTEQAQAISALSNHGASAVALRCFRALLSTASWTPSSFETAAKALLVTEHSIEVGQLLWQMLRDTNQLTALRLKASSLLFTPELTKDKRSAIVRFLKSTASHKTTSLADRFEAMEQWAHIDREAACELCSDIAYDTDTTFEEGMKAAQFLDRWADEYAAAEAYENIVWGEKIGLVQRVDGLLHIHGHVFPRFDEDGAKEDLLVNAKAALLRVAQDSSVSPDIRLRALALPPRSAVEPMASKYEDWPPEHAIEAFLHEKAASPRMKQECVLRFCKSRPVAAGRYVQHLELDTGDIALTLQCLEVAAKSGQKDLALQRLTTLTGHARITTSNRLNAIRAIHRLGEIELALRLAKELSRDDRGGIRLWPGAVSDVASFFCEARLENEALNLCLEALQIPLANDEEARIDIILFLARNGFSLQAKTALRQLVRMLDIGTNAPGWAHFHCAEMLERLGQKADACRAFMAIALQTSMDPFIRIEACRHLSKTACAEDATKILTKLARRKSLSADYRIQIAQCYIEYGLADLAKDQLHIAIKTGALSEHSRKKLNHACMQSGLEAQLQPTVNQKLANRNRRHAKAADTSMLLSLERWDDAKANLLVSREAGSDDALDMIELLGNLGTTPLKDFAIGELRKLTVDRTDVFERMRAAEILESMGEEDLAQETFLALAKDPKMAPSDRVWLASGLIGVNCDELAYQQLGLAEKDKKLTSDDRQHLRDLKRNYLN